MSMQPQMGEIALTITGRDIWEKLDRIETEVSGIPTIVADHEARLRAVQATLTEIASAALPGRVSKLETKMWAAAGFVAASGGTGALLAKYIGA